MGAKSIVNPSYQVGCHKSASQYKFNTEWDLERNDSSRHVDIGATRSHVAEETGERNRNLSSPERIVQPGLWYVSVI